MWHLDQNFSNIFSNMSFDTGSFQIYRKKFLFKLTEFLKFIWTNKTYCVYTYETYCLVGFRHDNLLAFFIQTCTSIVLPSMTIYLRNWNFLVINRLTWLSLTRSLSFHTTTCKRNDHIRTPIKEWWQERKQITIKIEAFFFLLVFLSILSFCIPQHSFSVALKLI